MTERIRGRRWMRIRARILRRDGGMCKHCAARGLVTSAEEVDHVVALHNGGTNDDDNLVSLCAECHKDKTRDDLGQRQRVAFGVDGLPL